MAAVYFCLDDKTLSRGVLTSKGTIVASDGKEYSSVSEWRADVMARLAKKIEYIQKDNMFTVAHDESRYVSNH